MSNRKYTEEFTLSSSLALLMLLVTRHWGQVLSAPAAVNTAGG